MKCIQVKENLDALLDDEINFSEKERIEAHLMNCESCNVEFENLQKIRKTMKQTLPIVAPASLDAKVFAAFENHNAETEIVKTTEKQEKIGWSGIPKFAFAVGLLLLSLFSGLAFQIGRISARNVQVSVPRNSENNGTDINEKQAIEKDLASPKTKIVEVPIIREKIVEVPVIKEKVVTKVVYKERKIKDKNKSNRRNLEKPPITQNDMRDFQIVSELKPRIIKTGENNEN